MENRTILFQGKEIDVDDEPGETSDMIHHPDHYTWKGILVAKLLCKRYSRKKYKQWDNQRNWRRKP